MKCAINSLIAEIELFNSRSVRIVYFQRTARIKRAEKMYLGFTPAEPPSHVIPVVVVEDENHVCPVDHRGFEHRRAMSGKVNVEPRRSFNCERRGTTVRNQMNSCRNDG